LGMVLSPCSALKSGLLAFFSFDPHRLRSEFRPMDTVEMQALPEQRWALAGVLLPDSPFTPEVVARLVRITGPLSAAYVSADPR